MAAASFSWLDDWDEEVGLWWKAGPGHTPPVSGLARLHPAPDAATRLLLAAQAGQLDRVPVLRVLTALRALQVRDGGFLYGCLKWFWEEPHLSDSNAAFFTGMSLLVLWKCYREALSAPEQETLLAILRDMEVWFARGIREKAFYYPNKYLGDLVCAWLLQEIFDKRDDATAGILSEAADYWLQQEWGWGEHLSDVYARVCLDQLSILLLLSERLPAAVCVQYTALFTELLELEDAYAGGPRVPSFRSYAFLDSPTHTHYRQLVRPVGDDLGALVRHFQNEPSLGHTLHALGWHQWAPAPKEKTRDVVTPCYGGVTATARVEDDIRLGSISRVPLMPSAEHLVWGMSWMCFPAVCWRPAGDWGFLQWATREDGDDHSHPEGVVRSYVGQSLTQHVLPPVVGRTYTIQHGGNLLALRVMPATPASWEKLADRFRLVHGTATPEILPATGPLAHRTLVTPGRAFVTEHDLGVWSQLLLAYPERQVSVQCLTLSDAASPELLQFSPDIQDWELAFTGEALQARRALVTLWGISLDGQVTEPPTLTPAQDHLDVPRSLDERPWRLHWRWPTIEWDVRIDPLSPTPLHP